MDKKYIIQFLKEKKRGVYALIVNTYVDVISAMGVNMALQVIKDDLEKETGSKVDINYYSLAKAVAKFEKRISNRSTSVITRKWDFKDAHEIRESQTPPGKFKLDQTG